MVMQTMPNHSLKPTRVSLGSTRATETCHQAWHFTKEVQVILPDTRRAEGLAKSNLSLSRRLTKSLPSGWVKAIHAMVAPGSPLFAATPKPRIERRTAGPFPELASGIFKDQVPG